MAVPTDITWPIEPHTVVKHKILRYYLDAWFPILNSRHDRVVYIDGFSGPGVYSGGEPGSPIIALKSAMEQNGLFRGELVFLFIEESEDRAAKLREEVGRLSLPSNFSVHIEAGQFEPVVTDILDQLERDGHSLAPTFAFIDPFGFSGIPFSVLERLLRHERSEALINFMVDSINRFVTAPQEEIRRSIAQLFGTDEVFQRVMDSGNRVETLTELYQEQLGKLGKFVRSFEMRNDTNRIIYYLQFVTKHRLGHLKMKEAMWRVDSEGDFRFSDATVAGQGVLFRADHTQSLLQRMRTEFVGKTVNSLEVRRFVEDSTAYLTRHANATLKLGEQGGLIRVHPLKVDGSKRHGKSFPDGVLVTFDA